MVAQGPAALVWRGLGDRSLPLCHAVALDERGPRMARHGAFGASTRCGIPGAKHFRTLRAFWRFVADPGPRCAPLHPPNYVFGCRHDCRCLYWRGVWLESWHAVVVDDRGHGFLLAFLRSHVVVPAKNSDDRDGFSQLKASHEKAPHRATKSVLPRGRVFTFARVVAASAAICCSTFRITASRSLTLKGLSKCASKPTAWLFSMSSLQP
jgi:hypothetical protein